MTAVKKPKGYIIYRGASALDSKPIVVIATGFNGKTNNPKTGDMVQTWILREDLSPSEAVSTGGDVSICGDCKHRGTLEGGRVKGRTCYVQVFHAPRVIFDAYQRGNYPQAGISELEGLAVGRNVRIGAYGDPSAVPVEIWESLTGKAAMVSGYTHQWRNSQHARLKYLTMASVDSEKEHAEAVAMGWRTFRVKNPSDLVLKGEAICPNTTVGITCADCGACRGKRPTNGGQSTLKGHIVITVHGVGAKAFKNLGVN